MVLHWFVVIPQPCTPMSPILAAKGTVSVPEPETMLMLGFVLLGLVGVSRKRFNNRN